MHDMLGYGSADVWDSGIIDRPTNDTFQTMYDTGMKLNCVMAAQDNGTAEAWLFGNAGQLAIDHEITHCIL